MEIHPVDSEAQPLGAMGYSPAHAAWLRATLATAEPTPLVENPDRSPDTKLVETGRTLVVDTGAPSTIVGRARRLHDILVSRYGGSTSTRELARLHRFKAEEVCALAGEYPELFQMESRPTTARGTPRRLVSAL